MTTCLEWASLLRQRKITAVAICQRYLDRIARIDRHYRAYRLVTGERALAQARAADADFAAGIVRSPLQGVPYAAKDLFDVAGLPTTVGCDLLAQHRAVANAAVIDRMDAAGMVLLGKANMVQWAHGSIGVNLNQGTPHNPWATEPVAPGGSSSGPAVAVAAGMAPIALGTDTGGSARVPPALCGVVGLKSTYGRIDRAGVYPLSTTLDSVGIIGLCPDDIGVLDGLLSGSPGAGAAAAPPAAAPAPRLAFATSLMAGLDQDVARAMAQVGALLSELGMVVDRIAFDEALQASALNPNGLISTVEGHVQNRPYLAGDSPWLDSTVLRSLTRGAGVAASDYLSTLRAMPPLRARAQAAMAPYDALLAPTTVSTAMPLAAAFGSAADFDSVNARYSLNTHAVNLLGLCAMTIPCGVSRAGLPIGLQIIGAAGADQKIIDIARVLVRTIHHGPIPRSPLLAAGDGDPSPG